MGNQTAKITNPDEDEIKIQTTVREAAAERTDRAIRSIRYQTSAARFPVHRDLAGFDFEQSKVDHGLISQLTDLSFTEAAHNVVFIGAL